MLLSHRPPSGWELERHEMGVAPLLPQGSAGRACSARPPRGDTGTVPGCSETPPAHTPGSASKLATPCVILQKPSICKRFCSTSTAAWFTHFRFCAVFLQKVRLKTEPGTSAGVHSLRNGLALPRLLVPLPVCTQAVSALGRHPGPGRAGTAPSGTHPGNSASAVPTSTSSQPQNGSAPGENGHCDFRCSPCGRWFPQSWTWHTLCVLVCVHAQPRGNCQNLASSSRTLSFPEAPGKGL